MVDFLGIVVIVSGVLALSYLLHRYPPKIIFRYERDDGTVAEWRKALQEAEDKEKQNRRTRNL